MAKTSLLELNRPLATLNAGSGTHPPPTQLASFLRKITGRLGQCMAMGGVPTTTRERWRVSLASVGWAVEGNQPMQGSEPPPLASLKGLPKALLAACEIPEGHVAT